MPLSGNNEIPAGYAPISGSPKLIHRQQVDLETHSLLARARDWYHKNIKYYVYIPLRVLEVISFMPTSFILHTTFCL